MKRISTLLTLVVALALVAFAGTAAADPGPTPKDGLTGAANMTNTNALPGMMHAMTVNIRGNGNAGMWCAVYITNGVVEPGGCP